MEDTGETDFDTFRDAWWGEADSEEAFAVEFIDRNLNPKKIKKTPKNGCLFNTACVP